MSGRLLGKVCIITGTGGSIGREAALVFAREGALVVGCGLEVDDAEATVEAVRAAGGTLVSLQPCNTGRLGRLDRLREQADPEEAIATLPGIGPVLAARIHRELGVETLPELGQAAQEGRLREVAGVGPILEGQIREALQARLRRQRARETEPAVEELLAVDREYREKADAGRLRTIAPRRFNPGGEAWLPVLETRRGDRRYTALYSNTALAHALGKTRDWVVLYYARPGEPEEQVTVVTENQGRLNGRRVVRGREQDCLRYYQAQQSLGRAA
jgi:DNA polymerase (family X)